MSSEEQEPTGEEQEVEKVSRDEILERAQREVNFLPVRAKILAEITNGAEEIKRNNLAATLRGEEGVAELTPGERMCFECFALPDGWGLLSSLGARDREGKPITSFPLISSLEGSPNYPLVLEARGIIAEILIDPAEKELLARRLKNERSRGDFHAQKFRAPAREGLPLMLEYSGKDIEKYGWKFPNAVTWNEDGILQWGRK